MHFPHGGDRDASSVYEAQEATHFWHRSQETKFHSTAAAQGYANDLLKKYAGGSKASVLVSKEPLGYAAGRTAMGLTPHNYTVRLDPEYMSRTNLLHEMAHVVAAETRGSVTHDAAFRGVMLRMFQAEDPPLGRVLQEQFTKSFHRRVARRQVIAQVVTPDGKVIECWGPK